MAIPPSFCMVISIASQKPARCSSIPLSSISQIRWCNPLEPTLPIYIPGRFLTASSPFNTTISLPSYLGAMTFSVSFLFHRACFPGFIRKPITTPRYSIIPYSSHKCNHLFEIFFELLTSYDYNDKV